MVKKYFGCCYLLKVTSCQVMQTPGKCREISDAETHTGSVQPVHGD